MMQINNEDKKMIGFSFLQSGKKIKILTKIKPKLWKVEFGIALIIACGYFFKIELLMLISLALLSALYLSLTHSEYKTNKSIKTFISEIVLFLICVGRSACVAGAFLSLMESSNPLIALYTGIILILLSFPFYLFYLIKRISDEIFSAQQLIRNVIIISSAALILFFYD